MDPLDRLSELTVEEIKSHLGERSGTLDVEYIGRLLDDDRKGVRELGRREERRYRADLREGERLRRLFACEREALDEGCGCVAGVDEAGRGPLAGPVWVAAVVFPPGIISNPARLAGLNDSKQMRAGERERLYALIRDAAAAVGTCSSGAGEIDRLGINEATSRALAGALGDLDLAVDLVFADSGLTPREPRPWMTVEKGDARVASIAAASIVAKVERDRWITRRDGLHPAYGFGRNKGYGTREHMEAIVREGPCELHRRTYIPDSLLREADRA